MTDPSDKNHDTKLFTDELFRQVPVSLWIEDFSAIHAIFEELKINGISDLKQHFREHPELVKTCAAAVRVLDVNQAAVDLHQAETRDQLLDNISLTFTKKSFEVFENELLTLANNECHYSSSTELRTLDGQKLFCLVKTFVDSDFENWSRIYVAITDISPLKNAEKALYQNMEHFRDLYDRAPTGYQSLDQDGCFLQVNGTMLEILGYERKDLLGHCFGEFLVPEERSAFEKNFQQFIAKGKAEASRFKMLRKDGSVLHAEFEGRIVVGPDGEFERTHCVMRDVTNQVVLEEDQAFLARQKELILLTVGDGILGLDPEGKIAFANPALEKITGWKVEELIGVHEHKVLHHTDKDGKAISRDQCPILTPILKGRGTKGKDIFWRKDGTSFPIEFDCQPIGDADSNAGAVLTFRDISEKENLERQVALSQKLEAVGQLAGGLAHDFNNILQMMMGEAELSLDGPSTRAECRNSLQSIKQGILKASGLTRQLLAFGRRQVLDKKVGKIDDLIENILRMLRRLVLENVEISFTPTTDEGLVFVDIGQIEQVLVNLCINARDAMPSGGKLKIKTYNVVMGEMFVENHPWARKGAFALITVSDTGCGMDQATLAQIFEPFFTTKAEGSGTGLGLSTAYGIIKQHDGFIHAYSEPGLGTTFRIYLPLSNEEENSEIKKSISCGPVGGTETILIAEDDESVREGFCRILGKAGYKVLTAENGLEALEMSRIHRSKIGLIILDVVMPKLSGPEVFSEIRETNSDLPIIFCSGHSRDLLNEDLLKEKDVVLINKPLSSNLLLTKVRELLDASIS